jgi:hypothetical protein
MDEEPRKYPRSSSVVIVVSVGLLLVLAIILACANILLFASGSYFHEEIKPYEVGVQTQSGRIKAIVGPGTYSDIGWDVGIEHISCETIPFTIEDPEVITKDRQRIAITVSGDSFRSCDKEFIEEIWPVYQRLYLEDDVLLDRIMNLSLQAMKSCVDDYDSDVILEGGNADLEVCIDDQLNALGEVYGLRIENLHIQETAASQ